MAIAAHDDHVGIQVGRGRQDRISNVLIVGHDTLEVDLEVMACKMLRYVRARQLPTVSLFITVSTMIDFVRTKKGMASPIARAAAWLPSQQIRVRLSVIPGF